MKPFHTLFAFFAALAFVAGCTARPTPLSPGTIVNGGKFSIWMPAASLEQDGDAEEIALADLEVPCQSYFARENGAYWLARHCLLPEGSVDDLTAENLLEEAEAMLLEEASGRILDSQTIQGAEFPARRIVAESNLRGFGFDEGTYMAQIQLVGNDLYLLSTYVYYKNYNNRLQAMEPFLDSFQLTDD